MSTTKEITRNLGGNRLGSGNKNNIDLHAYNRSTHDLTRTWRSSMTVGTLVPFLREIGLNGDTFSIDLDNIVRTLPSVGPLYGSYKLQLDVFEAPLRLYNGLLHNNMNGIGLNMAAVKFPRINIQTRVKKRSVYNEDLNKSQISKSSLINYLGLNGVGDVDFSDITSDTHTLGRSFMAIPLLAYWDIYKNYYANKQEEKGAFICAKPQKLSYNSAKKITFSNNLMYSEECNLVVKSTTVITVPNALIYEEVETEHINGMPLGRWTKINIGQWQEPIKITDIQAVVYDLQQNTYSREQLTTLGSIETNTNGDIIITLNSTYAGNDQYNLRGITVRKAAIQVDAGLDIQTFKLSDIDNMRIEILKNTGLNNTLLVNSLAERENLWDWMCKNDEEGYSLFKYHQHGLALKTYQSDLYNNWLQTEWIDGENGINKITAIDTSSGSFEIDALILGKKIYNMLNRIAVSGGSYEDWQEAVYSVKAIRRAETPIYRGGMSAEIMFSEVVSNSATQDEPLGTLAGKGGEHNKKGGTIEISCDEPCLIMGIVSITPRIDYSQGNSWILTELDSMDDLHKPAMDGIGFEDLLQERMAFWGTYKTMTGFVKMAAGKVPAWMNYMTAVNETHGDFAEEDKCMFMTLNRRYEFKLGDTSTRQDFGIADLTTYIDPRKYNYIFADTSLQAQNFWVQIGIGVNARRVMSAKVIPFL